MIRPWRSVATAFKPGGVDVETRLSNSTPGAGPVTGLELTVPVLTANLGGAGELGSAPVVNVWSSSTHEPVDESTCARMWYVVCGSIPATRTFTAAPPAAFAESLMTDVFRP